MSKKPPIFTIDEVDGHFEDAESILHFCDSMPIELLKFSDNHYQFRFMSFILNLHPVRCKWNWQPGFEGPRDLPFMNVDRWTLLDVADQIIREYGGLEVEDRDLPPEADRGSGKKLRYEDRAQTTASLEHMDLLSKSVPLNIELTDDQSNAIDKVVKWLKTDTRELSVGGYAGTGKTTMIRYLLTHHMDLFLRHGEVAVGCFTGKAAHVLHTKGVGARTLHSLMYKRHGKDADGQPVFSPKPRLDFGMLIVDEASMISKSICRDLRSFNPKVLWVGDMGQLEPIGDNPNLMAHPEVQLTRIHRQAEKSAIIRLSKAIRDGKSPWECMDLIRSDDGKYDEAWVGRKDDFYRVASRADQCLCATNRTRHAVNQHIRMEAGRGPDLEVGDKIICLNNNYMVGVFNGMFAEVTAIHEMDRYVLYFDFKDDMGNEYKEVLADPNQFGSDNRDFDGPVPWMTFWDYGYCVTVHKFQGSQAANVAVLEDFMHDQWDPRRWRYTAVTRAEDKVVYCA